MDNIKLSLLNFYQPQNYSHRFISIILIFTIFTTAVKPLPRTIDRSIIFENFVEHENQLNNSSRLIPCITTFVEEYFDHPDRILFVLPKVLWDIANFTVPLISELHTKSVINTLNVGATNISMMHDTSVNAVILSKNAVAFESSDICFSNYCERDCNFVIVLTDRFIDRESFLIEIDRLIQRICLGSIYKLAILACVGNSVLIASSFTVRINEIDVGSVLLGKCDKEVTATAIRWRRFANKTKLSLDTCRVVNAAMFENFPFALLINDTDYLKFGGVEGLMIEEIARSMKVKLNREVIVWSKNETIEKELQLRLDNSTKNDLVFGGLLRNFNREIEFTSSYGTVHITWMVPIETNVSLRGLVTPFSANVWYSIVCVIIIGGLTKLFFIRDISFLDIAALVLGVPIRQPTKSSSRIQYMAWVLFGFFITQLYLGSLAQQLMYASSLQIESMEELITSGLQIGGTVQFANLLETSENVATDEEDEVRRTIRENFIIFEQQTYINQIVDLVAGRNTSLAMIVMLNLSDTRHISNLGHAHIMKEIMGSYPLAFATWQGFPYLSDINFKIQVLFQAGIVDHWSDTVTLNGSYYEVENDVNDDNTKLDFEDITPAFLLLITGYLGGCCLFIVEIIFYPSRIFL